MFLVTTANTKFWNPEEKTLFLGEWCRRQDASLSWKNIDGKVLPYHWQSREMFLRDAQRLDEFYERYLPLISDKLNVLHNENHSTQYWRIIVGPWLYYFIGILFDRFQSIRSARASGEIGLTWLPLSSKDELQLNDFATLQSNINSDNYNLFLYSRIIQLFGDIPFEFKSFSTVPEPRGKLSALNPSQLFGIKLRAFYKYYSSKIPRRLNKHLFASLNWRPIDIIRLQVALGDFPDIRTPSVSLVDVKPEALPRDQLTIHTNGDKNNFEVAFAHIWPEQIPTAYVEHYKYLKEISLDEFPKRTKIIFSSNAHFVNEALKVWCANQLAGGAKLVGMPHGAHYGNALWSANEKHEKKVADWYMTWGWGDDCGDRVLSMPSGILAKTKKKIQTNKIGGLLWVGLSRPRYFNWMISAPTAQNMPKYISDQIVFIEALDQEVRNKLTLRLFHSDYGWGIKECLTNSWPNINFNSKNQTMYQQLRNNRLCIVTYNGTPMLETLAAGYPTIAFWDSSHWELRDSALSAFEEIIEAGILYYDPIAAATKTNEIYNDPIAWWESPKVTKARERFCLKFARTSNSFISDWKEKIYQISK